jgi:hypothetical protein
MSDKPPDVSFRLNPITGTYETIDNTGSVMTAGLPVNLQQNAQTQTNSNANSNWFFTPLGGANTKSPFEISLNGLSGLAGLVGNIYSTNKQVGVMKDQIKSNENIARANFANTISDAAYNRTNYANMVNGWGNQEFTNQTAQNALNSFNSLTLAANNLGISGDTLSAQKQQVKSLMG